MSTNGTTNAPPRDFGRAPGKIILSGEHAVVYGAPALAMAVERHTDVWFTPMHKTTGLRTAFENLSQGQFYPLDILKGFKAGLDERFEQFVNGSLPVQKVLQRPDDLAIYSLASLVPLLPVPGVSSSRKLPVPGQLSSRSDLPLGAGMGSSAAVIAATLVLYEHLMGLPQTQKDRFERVRFCERLQHGKGSAIDAAAVVYGGLVRVQSGAVTHPELVADHPLASGDGWFWVLDGTPESSTGECVAHVRTNFGHDTLLWQTFAACTDTLQTQLETGECPIETLRENQRLLTGLGVVPGPAQVFAERVNAFGGASKICGAGAVRGEKSGINLVYLPDGEGMTTLMAQHPDKVWAPLAMAKDGAKFCEARVPAQQNAAE